MASIFFSALVDVAPAAAWDWVDRYSRAEVHAFSFCTAERLEGEYRVVTLADGSEVSERNVTVDASRRRAVYTVPGLPGAEHHQAEMRVLAGDTPGSAVVEWCTDVLPHSLADQLRPTYEQLFAELIAAIDAQG